MTARCVVITVSDTRTAENDDGGAMIQEALTAAGHVVAGYIIVPDDPQRISGAIGDALQNTQADVVILSGGTGPGRHDQTPEVVQSWITRELPGFGELFRMLSYGEIGPAAYLSRATAGISGDSVLFCLPGSPAGVRLAMEKLILPELRHLVAEIRR